jgi:ribosomal protein S21
MQSNYKKDRPYNKDGKRPFKKRWSRQDFHLPGNPMGVNIPDPSIGALEKGLKYLKRQMKDGDIIGKYRSKKEYIKPSMKRRIQLEDAIRSEQYKNKMEGRRGKNYTWVAMLDGECQ